MSKINQIYFEQLDNEIKNKIKSITCDELSDMYFSFGESLKNMSGIAANFTWLSEFLIFRYLFHYLGSNFKCIRDTNSKNVYESIDNGQILAPNKKINVNGKTQEPDLVLLRNQAILRLISVKSTMLKVEEDIERISNLRFEIHANFKSVTIIFDDLGKSVKTKTRDIEASTDWHRYIFLKGNKENFYSVLSDKLKLNEV